MTDDDVLRRLGGGFQGNMGPMRAELLRRGVVALSPEELGRVLCGGGDG